MKIIKNLADIAAAACKSAAFKAGAVLLAGSIASGCFKSYFQDIFSPEAWHTQLTFDSEGAAFRANTQSDEYKQNSAEFSASHNESVIEAAGSAVDEKRAALDAVIKPSRRKNFIVRPRIQTLERTVTTAGIEESGTKGTFAAFDLRFGGELINAGRYLLIRPFYNCEDETSVAGNSTTKQYGFYAEGKAGLFMPVFSLETFDLGIDGIPDLNEIQVGTSIGGLAGNLRGSLGYFLVAMDDGTSKTQKHLITADLTAQLGGQHVVGLDGVYDGDLLSLGALWSYYRRGGNTSRLSEKMNKYIREMQRLNHLERGLPDMMSRNRREDLSRQIQGLDATLFAVLGLREEHDAVDWEKKAKPYALFGGNIPIKGREFTLGVSHGPVFEVYPADAVKRRTGVFGGIKLWGGRLSMVYEDVDYETRRDVNAFTIMYAVPLR